MPIPEEGLPAMVWLDAMVLLETFPTLQKPEHAMPTRVFVMVFPVMVMFGLDPRSRPKKQFVTVLLLNCSVKAPATDTHCCANAPFIGTNTLVLMTIDIGACWVFSKPLQVNPRTLES